MNALFREEDRRRSRPFAQWAEGILLTVGLLCFCWFGYNWVASQATQMWSNYALDARLAGKEPTVTGLLRQIARRPEPAPKENDASTAWEARKSPRPIRKVAEGED